MYKFANSKIECEVQKSYLNMFVLTEYCREIFGKFWIFSTSKCRYSTIFVLEKVVFGACYDCKPSAVFG